MAEKETYTLTKLNGQNFPLWRFSVSHLLESQDLVDFVKGEDIEPDNATRAQDWKVWKKHRSKASVILLSSIEVSLHANLINCATPKEMWDKLHALYGDVSEDLKQNSWQDFYKFTISDGEPIATQIEKFETICKKLDGAGEKPSDSAIMSRLLDSLPTKFSAFRMAWESTSSTERRKENLIARIVREERRLITVDEEETSLALRLKNLYMKQENSSEKASSSNQTKAKKSKRNIKELKQKFACNYCHEKGHWYRECPKRVTKTANKDEGDNTSKSAEAYNTVACASTQQFQECESVWIADSGASMHMTPHREVFREIQPANDIKFVKAAGGRIMPVSGTGIIDITVSVNGKEEDRQLQDVLLVPDLQYNLFSVSAATRKGYSFHIDRERCEIRRANGDLSAVGVRHGEMYKMLLKTKKQIECLVVEEKSLRLWHERMGHINVSAIKQTDHLKAVNGMKIDKKTDFFCEPCVLGKQSRVSHYTSERTRVDTPGEMIHSDVCGPINVESLGGSRYFVLFKDDCTGFRSVYFLRYKSEVPAKFKEYEALVNRLTGNNVKILRSDNGKEYMSKEFQMFLKTKGIVHERSAPYVPQQNGRAEREMRTLVESARTMLIAKDLPIFLWAEAVRTAAYVLNRTISKQAEDKTAYEKWFGRAPEVKHLRIFGSVAYQNIPKQFRKKFDEKSRKKILVGYEAESTNYRLFDEQSRKIFVRCDVTFNEELAKSMSESLTDEQVTINLDFGNYDEPTIEADHEEQDVDFESAESSQGEEEDAQVENVADQPSRMLRDRRTLRSPVRYSEFGYASVADAIPQSYESAVTSVDAARNGSKR